MPVQWSRYDPGDVPSDAPENEINRAFEARIASYTRLGWAVVQREDDPPRAWLSPRQQRSRWFPSSSSVTDAGHRLLWVDEAGTIRTTTGEGPVEQR